MMIILHITLSKKENINNKYDFRGKIRAKDNYYGNIDCPRSEYEVTRMNKKYSVVWHTSQ